MGGRSLPGEPPERARRQAQGLLERQVEEVRAAGGTVADSHLRMGQPAYEVAGLSDELEADMLVGQKPGAPR